MNLVDANTSRRQEERAMAKERRVEGRDRANRSYIRRICVDVDTRVDSPERNSLMRGRLNVF